MISAIFDMDGVLVDSHDIIWASHNEVLSHYNVHLNDEDVKKYLGKSLRDDIEEWNKEYGLSLDLETHTKAAWEIQLRMLEELEADPNLVTFLEDLKSHDVPMGVGTNSQRFRAEKILELLKLENYFPEFVTASDVQRHKPFPDLFLEVARKLNTVPERCVVLEDAYGGIEAAKSGNMKAIGYSNGRNEESELRNSDLIIRDFSEVSYEKISKMFS